MPPAQVRERTTADDEAQLLARLRAGDEQAFEALVTRYYGTMLAVARTHVKTRAVAEEVVQEAWLGVLQSLDRFEGRSSLKTWIVSILVHKAKTRGVREARSVPFASLAPEGDEAAVDPERFRGTGDGFPGHWRAYPSDWAKVPEAAAEDAEMLAVAMRAIEALPPAQRTVIAIRDVAGCTRRGGVRGPRGLRGQPARAAPPARSRVRSALETYFDG